MAGVPLLACPAVSGGDDEDTRKSVTQEPGAMSTLAWTCDFSGASPSAATACSRKREHGARLVRRDQALATTHLNGTIEQEDAMAVTKQDLRDFTQFADARLAGGGAGTLVELAGEWEVRRREADETVAAIRQSHADIEAGRVAPVADAFAEVRRLLDRG